MSYLEELTGRRDYLQSQAFLVARRFMHHVKTDPIGFDFPLPFTEKRDDATNNARYNDHETTPILHGFAGRDLVLVQYGRMVSIIERGLNPVQQKRWQNLEAELLAPSVIGDFYDSIIGKSNHAPEEVFQVARQLNNPYIMARLDDVALINAFLEPVREVMREAGELEPAAREIKGERVSNPLLSFYDLLQEFLSDKEDASVSEAVRRIDDYIIQKLLPSTE